MLYILLRNFLLNFLHIQALQEDYKRFMDYTDGKFHSDYLMRLRYMGLRLAEKDIPTVTYEDIEPFNLESVK